MKEKVDLRYYILDAIDRYGNPYNEFEKCLCSKGASNCSYIMNGKYSSIWNTKRLIEEGEKISGDRAYDLLRNKDEGLYNVLKEMTVDGKDVVVSLFRESLFCINPEFKNEVKEVLEKKDSSILFERSPVLPESPRPVGLIEGIKPLTIPKIELKLKKQHPVGVYWGVGFDATIKEGTAEMWKTTEDEGIETQTALCLDGDTINVLKDSEGKQIFIKGREGEVEAFSRELKCPTDTIKVGTLHTHPPSSQEELKKTIADVDVELTNEQSIADLNLLMNSDEIMTCTRSKQSITCFVNTTMFDMHSLLRDNMGDKGLMIDKQKLKGILIDKGIQKFKLPFVGMQSKNGFVCSESLDTGDIGCAELPPKFSFLDMILQYKQKSDSDNILAGYIDKKTSIGEILKNKKGKGSSYHFSNVETIVSEPVKDGSKLKRYIFVSPYTTNKAFCWEGEDGGVWCDGLKTLDEIQIRKEQLLPRFEKQVWNTMYDKLDQDFTTSSLWKVMENYVKVLEISSDDVDVKKRDRAKGIMKEYLTRKDNNAFVRNMLPLIRLG